jgi:PAS domain-containing protein
MDHSEEHLRAMFDAIPALAWTCLPDGAAEILNPRWADYTHPSWEESFGCLAEFRKLL